MWAGDRRMDEAGGFGGRVVERQARVLCGDPFVESRGGDPSLTVGALKRRGLSWCVAVQPDHGYSLTVVAGLEFDAYSRFL